MVSQLAQRDLYARIKDIPHLRLGMLFDPSVLQEEFSNLPPNILKPYQSRTAHSEILDKLSESWHGATLVGPWKDPYSAVTETPVNAPACQPTTLAPLCPTMMGVIEKLAGFNTISRIMAIKPGGHLSWHSHYYDHKTGPAHGGIVLHVPILMPEKFRYSVTSYWRWRMGDVEKQPLRFFNDNYQPGEAVVFNSHHLHNVFNDDRTDRISLMIYGSLANEQTASIVDAAARAYEGPMIEGL